MSADFSGSAFPPKWRRTNLGEVVRSGGGHIQTGPFGSQLHASDYVSSGVPSIMPVNIGDGRLIEDGIARVTEADANRLGRHRVLPGDIVYSRRGDVERCALIRPEHEGWLCGTGCLKIRFGRAGVNPRFAYYFLSSPVVRHWIVRHAIGATMPNLNTSIMGSVPFVVPPLREQDAIVSILGTLDDKIELNRRMCRTLEAMAQSLFKSWFIDFNPVRAKAAGQQPPGLSPEIAALFPASYQNSDLGGIPRGWRRGRIDEVACINAWTLGRLDHVDIIDYIEISEVMRGEVGRITRYQRGEEPSRARRRLRHGDTVLSTVRPDRGAYFLALNPADTLIASTGFAVLSPKDLNWAFLHAATTSPEFGLALGRLADGGAYPAIRPEVIGSRSLVLPNDSEVVSAYDRIVQPIFLRTWVARNEGGVLAQVRDALLPELISGELRILDAERIAARLV